MSHGKETPRQKLIGMMYLVFLAMVAINVAGEVMLAFEVIDEGLTATLETIESTNHRTMAEFEEQLALNETKVKPWYTLADEVSHRANEIVEFIQAKKIQIVVTSEGTESPAVSEGKVIASLIEGKDKMDVPYNIMVGENDNLAGDSLQKMMDEFMHWLLDDVVAPDAENAVKSITASLSTSGGHGEEHGSDHGNGHESESEDDHASGHGGGHASGGSGGSLEHHSWSMTHFAHLPLSGVIAIMSGLQINVRNAESEALRYLFNEIDAGSFKFNKLDATIIPNSSYVIKGNAYTAEVFLAASDSTAKPKIYYTEGSRLYDSVGEGSSVIYTLAEGVNYDTLPVDRGIGRFLRPAQSIGERTWGGIIEITGPTGEAVRRPFRHTYMVAEGSITVSATKMNVFYVGVDNPVEVSVAGVRPDAINIKASNAVVKQERSGSYVIKPRRPGNSIVRVYQNGPGGSKEVGFKDFRVKNVPDPEAKVNNQKGGRIAKNILLLQFGVTAQMPEDFDFDLTFKVISFTVSASVGGFSQDLPAKSNKFTTQQKALIENLQRGDKIYITDIKAIGPDGSPRPLSTIDFIIN